MNTDAFGNPIPDGLNQPSPIVAPSTPPPPTNPQPMIKSQTAPFAPQKSKPKPENPVAKSQRSQSKLDSLTATTKQAVKDGINQGLGDEVAAMLKTILHNLLMAPYDIMNYSLVSFILLSPPGKKRFLGIVIMVSLGLAVPWLYLFIKFVDITYIFYIVGALLACLLVFMGMSLNASTPAAPTKSSKRKSVKASPTKKQSKPQTDFDDVYIE